MGVIFRLELDLFVVWNNAQVSRCFVLLLYWTVLVVLLFLLFPPCKGILRRHILLIGSGDSHTGFQNGFPKCFVLYEPPSVSCFCVNYYPGWIEQKHGLFPTLFSAVVTRVTHEFSGGKVLVLNRTLVGRSEVKIRENRQNEDTLCQQPCVLGLSIVIWSHECP